MVSIYIIMYKLSLSKLWHCVFMTVCDEKNAYLSTKMKCEGERERERERERASTYVQRID